jgi:hypothetical protein
MQLINPQYLGNLLVVTKDNASRAIVAAVKEL